MSAPTEAGDATPDDATILGVLRAVHDWSEQRDWRGHEKHDALNSPLLRRVAGDRRWLRLLAIQGVMRFPFDLRGILRVPRVHNPKGLALFAQSCIELAAVTGEPVWRARAAQLFRLLDATASTAPSGARAWGYLYPWQDLGFFAPSGTPNAVVSCHVGEALLDGYAATSDASLLERVTAMLPFFLHDLRRLKDEADELCVSYMPLPMSMRVMDVSILVGALIARWARVTGDTRHSETAARLVRYVVRRQTPEGAWFYTDPPRDSPIRHDNYHTGFILDALHRYRQSTGDPSHDDAYARGLAFYRERLFEPDGAPRWMSDVAFPRDIHGAAQGILTFARHAHEHPGFARRIAGWALAHLYDPAGRFHYQQTRFRTKRVTYMRWCNGWMVRALAHLMRSCAP